jgi:amidase
MTERLGRLWDDVDVLLTPTLASLPLPVGAYEGRGALWTFNGAGRFVPHLGIWNMTGQPAASVPAGFTPDGVPLAVQLVARSSDEATLLTLSAQLEAERPWAASRPPMAS